MTDHDDITFSFNESNGFNLEKILTSLDRAIRMALADYYYEHGKKPYTALFDVLIPAPLEHTCITEVREFGVIGMGKKIEKDGFHPLRMVFVHLGEKEECDTFNQRMNDIIKVEYPSYGSKYTEIPL
jgi:hypothetical protein